VQVTDSVKDFDRDRPSIQDHKDPSTSDAVDPPVQEDTV